MELTKAQRTTIINRCRNAGACEPEFEKLLAAESNEDFLKVLIRNIGWCHQSNVLTSSILTELAKNESVNVRSCVALSPKTPAVVLKKLSKDESVDVRCSVALNKRASKTILQELVKDGDWLTRFYAKKYRNRRKFANR